MKNYGLRFGLFWMLLAFLAGQNVWAYDVKVDGLCYNINSDGVTATLTYENSSSPSYVNLSGSLNIPDKIICGTVTLAVTEIGYRALRGCSGLTSVTIPNTINKISYSAFYGCDGLEIIDVDSENSFYDSRDNCNAIIETASNTLVVGCKMSIIPETVSCIGSYAFSGCAGLTSVTIPTSVTSIGDMAFENTNLSMVNIPNSVIGMGVAAFTGTPWYNNQPDGLIYLGRIAYRYKGEMPAGTSINILDGTKGIAGDCFGNCGGLSSVSIPNSVLSIGESAFSFCSGLSDIYSYIKAPSKVHLGDYVFSNKTTCVLHVPAGTLNEYKVLNQWKDFVNVVEMEGLPEPDVLPGDVNGDNLVNVIDYVTTASYILEEDPQPFVFAAADLDGNGTVTVGDLVGVADLALNFEGAAPRRTAGLAKSNASLSLDASVMTMSSNRHEVTIELNNNIDLTAMQLDVALPAGMTMTGASLSDRATNSHDVNFAQLANGNYRVLAASPVCNAFKGSEGAVLTLTLEGSATGTARLSGVEVVTPSANSYVLDDVLLDFTVTGLADVNNECRIYREDGNIVIISPDNALASIVLPNGMHFTKKVFAGKNTISAPANGIVIVRVNGHVAKIRF